MTPNRKNGTVLFDGQKAIDLWNGDEGWVIHSGEGSETKHGQYLGVVPTLYRAVTQRARAIANMPFALVGTGDEDYDTSRIGRIRSTSCPTPKSSCG
jgi:hypothetical protein